ncbi:MAG: DUF4175 domain-containing protein [Hyphomonadaceae bacterium]|nr:DUF4175 domain-containing protein [Hyphomonadaceae bacterium]
MKHQDALAQLARETARARRVLAFERALRAALPLLAALTLWAVLASVGAHQALPYLLQSVTALGALCIFILLTARASRGWRTPTHEEARARLVVDSRYDAGVFDALQDHPARLDPVSAAFWRRERERALARAEDLRVGPPRPRLNELDPWRLRYLGALLLILALVVAGTEAPSRLSRAFLPDPGPLLGDQPMIVEAWATPAEYTRASAISLSDRIGDTVVTPPSVTVTVRVTGPVGAPMLMFDGAREDLEQRFARTADGAWEAQLTLPEAGHLKVVRFHTHAAWRIAPARDEAPRVAFTAPIMQLSDEMLAVSWRARDDFGVRRLALRVRPIAPPPGLARADAVDTEIETPAGDPTEAEAEVALDVSAHPYAGMEVEARVVAFDALGQEGVSGPMRVTLPEKVFLQPLARAATEIRRHVLAERRAYRAAAGVRLRDIVERNLLHGGAPIEVRDYEARPPLQRAPEGVRRAVRLLDALTMAPEDGYFRDLAVFLGLRMARSQLAVAERIEDTNLAADTLWRTALRAEYGGAADARRALEEAQRQLAEALAQGAPQERVRQLVEALRRATENYMQALVQEALRNGGSDSAEDTQDQAQISERDIEEMMREVERLAEQGRHEEAQQMLDMLAGILANLDVRLDQQQAEGGEGQEQQLQQSMDGLSQTMGEQRALQEETRQEQRQQQQQSGQGGQGGGEQRGGQSGEDLAQRQAQIREGLAQAQRQANEAGAAPSNELNAAGEAMRRAEDALRRGDLAGAEAAQSAALDSLREGADALAAAIREGGREGARDGDQGEGAGGRDPLGRRSSGVDNGEGGASIPDQSDPVRAREVFDEIRRRAEDPNRPEAEREYLRRLLDRFSDS